MAALAVLVGHAFALTKSGPAPEVLGFTIHKVGVAVFFCISGYLIAGSWYRVRCVRRYLWHRFLRIIPALWVVVIVTTSVVGPLATSLEPRDYFRSGETYEYLGNLSTVATYRLPGVFTHNPTSAVNGSLWTIGVEVVCYLSLLTVVLVPPAHATVGFAAAAVIMATATFTVATKGGALPGLGDAAPVMVYFFAGALMNSVARVLGVAWRPVHSAAALVGWVILYAVSPGSALVASWVFLPLCIIPVGLAAWPTLRSASLFGDISYGVYLWGFLVQQLVIAFAGPMSVWADVVIVLGLTLVCAVISCHAVERPALRLKQWSPRRRSDKRAAA